MFSIVVNLGDEHAKAAFADHEFDIVVVGHEQSISQSDEARVFRARWRNRIFISKRNQLRFATGLKILIEKNKPNFRIVRLFRVGQDPKTHHQSPIPPHDSGIECERIPGDLNLSCLQNKRLA